MTIPLMSEFLYYKQGDTDREKQDCEQRAFYRLAKRFKKAFSHLPILLFLDGLFATGPVMEFCKGYNWEYMIVLQDGSLPYVWEEYRGLKKLFGEENSYTQDWSGRKQQFQ